MIFEEEKRKDKSTTAMNMKSSYIFFLHQFELDFAIYIIYEKLIASTFHSNS